MNKKRLENIKKSIVFIWRLEQRGDQIIENVNWTWTLIQINWISYLLTAKHVIAQINQKTWEVLEEYKNLMVFLNLKTEWKNTKVIELDKIKQQHDVKFIYHKDSKVDIALIPITINMKEDDVLMNTPEYTLNIEELMETDEAVYIWFQPWVSSLSKDGWVKPIIRKWNISRINEDKTYYIDWFVFPGNSWSPVFATSKYIKENDKWVAFWNDWNWGKMIWIINSYVPYQDTAYSKQTWKARVIFEENTGLSVATSVNIIKEIISYKKFIKQEKQLKKTQDS